MEGVRELEAFAACAHGGMAMIHGWAAITGKMPAALRGAAVALHLEAICYNAVRPDNRPDLVKHGAALLQLLFAPDDRLLNALAALYDAAAAWRHYRSVV